MMTIFETSFFRSIMFSLCNSITESCKYIKEKKRIHLRFIYIVILNIYINRGITHNKIE